MGLFWSVLLVTSVGTGTSLRELVEEVTTRNPQILAAQARYDAASAQIPAEGWLGDPMITWQKMFMEDAWGITQPVPFPLKLLAKRRAAQEAAESQWEEAQAMRLTIRTQAKLLFFEYAYLQEAVRVVQEIRNLLQAVLPVAQRRFETGGDVWEALRIETEIARLENRLASQEARRRSILARINALRNRPPDTPLGEVVLPDLPHDPMLSPDSLRTLALGAQPLVRAQRNRVQHAAALLSLSRWSLLPDLKPDLMYRQDAREWKISLGLRIPLWFPLRQVPQIRAKEAALRAQEALLTDWTNQTLRELEQALADWARAAQEHRNYEQIILPRAQEALKVAEAGYTTGKLGFLEFLNSEVAYLSARLALWKTYTDLGKAIARTESVIGQELWLN